MDLLKKIGVLAGIALSALSPKILAQDDIEHPAAEHQTYESKASLQSQIEGLNVELRGQYREEELKDILEVLGKFRNSIGDVSRFDFSISKFSEGENLEGRLDISSDTEPWIQGRYWYTGLTNSKTHKVFIAPKIVLDLTDAWQRKHDKKAKGEEGKIYNFKWVLTHELAHSLSFKLGYGQELKDVAKRKPYKYPFTEVWMDLSEQIEETCPEIRRIGYGWDNIRPEGFPSHRAYFANSGQDREHEIFAETVAYILLGNDYADHDPWVLKRVELLKKEFERIKSLS